MLAVGAARRVVVGAAGRLAGAGRALAGLPFAAGLAAGFFFAGIGIVMPGIAEWSMPCID